MLRSLTLCVLALTAMGCGDGGRERAELKAYIDKMAEFDAMNREIADFIVRLDQPQYEITSADLEEARALANRYIDQMQSIESTAIGYRELRSIHDLYGRKLEEARSQVVDTGRELKHERINVAIGLRYIEKMTEQHYKALDVLWLRTDQPEEFPLQWPE